MMLKHTILQRVAIALLACLLNACDGGIFGTGDGLPVMVDSSDVMDESAPSSSADTVETGGDGGSAGLTEIFDNVLTGTSSMVPQINLMNMSRQSINASLSTTTTEPLFDSSIASLSVSPTAELSLGMNTTSIVNSEASARLSDTFLSINVGASSLTTLLVRDTAVDGINVVPLRTQSISPTPSVAQVRMVQARLLSDQDNLANFSLVPSGDLPGAAAVLFSSVSYDSAMFAEYQAISVGDYRLVDSLNRMAETEVTLQAGKMYTLIVLGDEETPILLHDDSVLTQ